MYILHSLSVVRFIVWLLLSVLLLCVLISSVAAQSGVGVVLDPQDFAVRQKAGVQSFHHKAIHSNKAYSNQSHSDPLTGANSDEIFVHEHEIPELELRPIAIEISVGELEVDWLIGEEDEILMIIRDEVAQRYRQDEGRPLEKRMADSVELFVSPESHFFTFFSDPFDALSDEGRDVLSVMLPLMGRLIARYRRNGEWVYVYEAGGQVHEVGQSRFTLWCQSIYASKIEIELENDPFAALSPESYQAMALGCSLLPEQVPAGHLRNWLQVLGVAEGDGQTRFRFKRPKTDKDIDVPGILEWMENEGVAPVALFDKEKLQRRRAPGNEGRGGVGKEGELQSVPVPYKELFMEELVQNDKELLSGHLVQRLTQVEQELFLLSLGATVAQVEKGVPAYLNRFSFTKGAVVTALFAVGRGRLLNDAGRGFVRLTDGSDYSYESFVKDQWNYHVETAIRPGYRPWLNAAQYIDAKLVQLLSHQGEFDLSAVEAFERMFPATGHLSAASLSLEAQMVVRAREWFRSGDVFRRYNYIDAYEKNGDAFLARVEPALQRLLSLRREFVRPANDLSDAEKGLIENWVQEKEKKAVNWLLEKEVFPESVSGGRFNVPRGVDFDGLTAGELFSALYVISDDTTLVEELAELSSGFAVMADSLFNGQVMGRAEQLMAEPVRVVGGQYLFNQQMLVYLAHRFQSRRDLVRNEYRPGSESFLAAVQAQYNSMPRDEVYSHAWQESLRALQQRLETKYFERRKAVFMCGSDGALFIKIPFRHYASSYQDSPMVLFCSGKNCKNCKCAKSRFSRAVPPEFLYRRLGEERNFCPMCPPERLAPLFNAPGRTVSGEAGNEGMGHVHGLRQVRSFDLAQECARQGRGHRDVFRCDECKADITVSESDSSLMYVCDHCFSAQNAGPNTGYFKCMPCQRDFCLKHHGGGSGVLSVGELMENEPAYLNGVVCDKCEQLVACQVVTAADQEGLTRDAIMSMMLHCEQCQIDGCASCFEAVSDSQPQGQSSEQDDNR
ncbi:hypothetical protein EOPP23_19860 [Endozoicomonas sp. OPT23]|uniref:hypothetical protein n=1 Tax=Endozoicomonas sp. OPT23 TaxID=2072845 RepID=UPI00129B62E7|nr:hypothetical protein [Endozoicomonas sp. OPT23]MRI35228.1 hypothetical protein [Endozoicomonas sp. OPT23]